MSPIVLVAAAAVASSVALLFWVGFSGRTARQHVAGNLGVRLEWERVKKGT